jgi:tetratricopeptide (TPR) repeat protein
MFKFARLAFLPFASSRNKALVELHQLEVAMPAVRIVQTIAVMLVSFFLSAQHSILARGRNEAVQLDNRAQELKEAGRYTDAELLYKRALSIEEKESGPNHLYNFTATLNNLAVLYADQGRYADALALHEQSLAIIGESAWSQSSRRCAAIEQSGFPVPKARSLRRCGATV